MKTQTFIFMITFLCMTNVFAQKKENGKVYIEHPAINAVNDFNKAFVAGDKAKMAGFLTDDFKFYYGTEDTSQKAIEKEAFLKNQLRFFNELNYFSSNPFPGAYPDAIEYVKDNNDHTVWVQTWDLLEGVHKDTGVKVDQAVHNLYVLTKNNKIKTIISYDNPMVFDEIGLSMVERTNGRIYDHHDFINTVRKSTYAFEKGDLDKVLSYYSDDAKFYDINEPYGTPGKNKTEIKKDWQKFLDTFEIENVEMRGYPDYLEYERDNGRSVLSWWIFHLIRKSDKKKIDLYMHISNDFNSDGKIVREVIYYGGGLLSN